MKAIIFEAYGSPDVLQLVDIAEPIPTENQVLVKLYAAAANAADWHIMRAEPFVARLQVGIFRPKKIKILGADIAGVVEKIGNNVTRFAVGDRVFGDISSFSGKGPSMGGFAEFVAVEQDLLAKIPDNCSFEDAAATPLSAISALQAIRKAEIKAGQTVLINGASGGVGTFAIQLVKLAGAEVTAVCSQPKHELALSLGADHVIDYRQEDFTQNGKKYDAILVVNGNRPIKEYQSSLTPTGHCVIIGDSNKHFVQGILFAPFLTLASKQKMGMLNADATPEDMQILADHLAQGNIRPIIDRRFPLEQTADAMRYLEEGSAKGKIIIEIV